MNEETPNIEKPHPNKVHRMLNKFKAAFTAALLAENEWVLYNVCGDNPHVAAREKAEREYQEALCKNGQDLCGVM